MSSWALETGRGTGPGPIGAGTRTRSAVGDGVLDGP